PRFHSSRRKAVADLPTVRTVVVVLTEYFQKPAVENIRGLVEGHTGTSTQLLDIHYVMPTGHVGQLDDREWDPSDPDIGAEHTQFLRNLMPDLVVLADESQSDGTTQLWLRPGVPTLHW